MPANYDQWLDQISQDRVAPWPKCCGCGVRVAEGRECPDCRAAREADDDIRETVAGIREPERWDGLS
jgi:hypothetical protein